MAQGFRVITLRIRKMILMNSDLIFSLSPESIGNTEIIPGMSDHEAVYCELTYHPVFLYDKSD